VGVWTGGAAISKSAWSAAVRFGELIEPAGMLTPPPKTGQRVRVVGSDQEYMVIRVDRKRHMADLMRMSAVPRVESGVLLVALRPVPEISRVLATPPKKLKTKA
jgi:hypothetical protein